MALQCGSHWGQPGGKVLALVAIAWLIQQRGRALMGLPTPFPSGKHHALPLSLCMKGITAW